MKTTRKKAFRVTNGTFVDIVRQFMLSDDFLSKKPGTITNNRRLLGYAMRHEVLGGMKVHDIRPSHVKKFLDTLNDRPGTKANARSALLALESWAIVEDKLPGRITTGTKAPRDKDAGYEPWTDDQIALAERETPPHLSRAITLEGNTGQRGSDIVNMRWSDIETHGGRQGIRVKQIKTGVEVWVPFTDELMRAMSGWEKSRGFILLKEDGTPWGNRHQLTNQWLRARDRLPALEPLKGLVMHGLRATAVIRLRRGGCTTLEICSTVGMSDKMVVKYSKKAEQIDLALAAARRMTRTANEQSGVLTFEKPK